MFREVASSRHGEGTGEEMARFMHKSRQHHDKLHVALHDAANAAAHSNSSAAKTGKEARKPKGSAPKKRRPRSKKGKRGGLPGKGREVVVVDKDGVENNEKGQLRKAMEAARADDKAKREARKRDFQREKERLVLRKDIDRYLLMTITNKQMEAKEPKKAMFSDEAADASVRGRSLPMPPREAISLELIIEEAFHDESGRNFKLDWTWRAEEVETVAHRSIVFA